MEQKQCVYCHPRILAQDEPDRALPLVSNRVNKLLSMQTKAILLQQRPSLVRHSAAVYSNGPDPRVVVGTEISPTI